MGLTLGSIGAWGKKQLEKRGVLHYVWRVFVGLLATGWVAALYVPMADLTAGRSVDLMTPLDEAIPFIPWTWWIYFPGYLAGLLFAIVTVRSNRIYFLAIATITISQVLNSMFYIIMPSTYPRLWDWEGSGLTAEAIHWFWTIDPPNNTFPSSHVCIATIAAIVTWIDRSPGRIVPTLSAVGIFITVTTTKQHYWIDSVAGAAMAFLCVAIVFRWLPRLYTRFKT